MSDRDPLLQDLLGLMGRELHALEPPEALEDRRVRVVGRLRGLHGRLLDQRKRARQVRRRVSMLLVAMLALCAGAALASVGRFDRFSTLGAQLKVPKPMTVLPSAMPSGPQRTTHLAPPSPLPTTEPPATPAPSAAVRGHRSIQNHSAALEPPPPAQSPAERELAAVNQLFSEAKRARREGQNERALLLCEELLAKYPRSVLAHEATVERLRALKRLGRHDEAERRAREYLAQYPAGFAASEAKQMVEATAEP